MGCKLHEQQTAQAKGEGRRELAILLTMKMKLPAAEVCSRSAAAAM
jgi:hypothetical protein